MFVDNTIKLNGPLSILGRSIVIHGNGTNTPTASAFKVAQGIIGKVEESSVNVDTDMRTVYSAGCRLEPTALSKNPNVGGFIIFNTETGGGAVSVQLFATGLPPGPHG